MCQQLAKFVSIATLCCLTGTVSAACLTDFDFTDPNSPYYDAVDPKKTNAIGVQADSGQGNYDCSVLTNPKGDPLQNLYPGQATYEFNDDGTISWSASITGGKAAPIYFVSTNSSGQGKRCNYLYDGTEIKGDGLGADVGDVNSVTICGDPNESYVVDTDNTDIITTEGQQCFATVNYDNDNDIDTTTSILPDVTIGFTSEVEGQTITVCGLTTSQDSFDLDLGQRQCTPPPYVQTGNVLTESCYVKDESGDPTGEILLDCAPVDIEGAPLNGDEYCWYYENRVCESGSDEAYCYGRSPNTFTPKSKKDTLSVQIDTFDGSTCYTYYLYGRAYFHCR